MKNNISLVFFFLLTFLCFSQHYEFETVIDLEATDVISQGKTGTCWSFSTSSFLESEIMRISGKKIDLSEMYNVRHTYPKKAWNYVMRQGKTQFSEGGLAHDVINSIREYGVVPNDVYSGLKSEDKNHNHSELVTKLNKVLDEYIADSKNYKTDWKKDIDTILDNHLGENISEFNYEGTNYTPLSFLEFTNINPNDYVSITSFDHVPYHTEFILNIPDNFSNGKFLNVPLDELVSITNTALKNGFSIELDCDVSEKTFSSKYGIAVIPENELESTEALKTILKEKKSITQELRQREFENYNTTDDHLMHITGLLKDQNGTRFYKVKNSWGKNSERIGNNGYIYMSEAYFKLKTISIMIHKDVLKRFKGENE